ncbi:SDR family oxidoreductase [Novosphingobium malaysiense]|uniref:Short-chain dehydrogenase n=1 Tax=Novosphingobium malaysiense TaxID=1348853 RepID=A0A0B1ZD39_9SPHN|nr:SDR family oxidoreductase [Novosphingobium malaysiense]KHK88969.1 short-chain dehydrogenase [Novosphingobium malaysiense]
MPLPEPPQFEQPFLPAGTFGEDVVLITGGGTGLGKAMARMFASMGARVAIASRKEEHRLAGVEAVQSRGGQALAVPLDVRKPEQIAEAFDMIGDGLGPVSILVNNAAGRFMAPAEDLTPNGWRAVTDIVMDGTFFCSQEFHRCRIEAGEPGAILNIGATFAFNGGPGSVHSAAAKAAVTNMTKTLAVEWAVDGIRVNTLAPGWFPHDDTAEHMKGPWRIGKEGQMPGGRAGRLQELAWSACFLCSPFARYITGHTLVVDGASWLRHRSSHTQDFVPVRDWARTSKST